MSLTHSASGMEWHGVKPASEKRRWSAHATFIAAAAALAVGAATGFTAHRIKRVTAAKPMDIARTACIAQQFKHNAFKVSRPKAGRRFSSMVADYAGADASLKNEKIWLSFSPGRFFIHTSDSGYWLPGGVVGFRSDAVGNAARDAIFTCHLMR